MKFRPLHDRVLIKVLDSEEKTAGGIIIPDTAKEKPQEGEVVATGPGSKSEDGKVIYQRDFLDVGAMIYEHVPLLGKVIRYLKQRMNK